MSELSKVCDEVSQCQKCGLGRLRLKAVPGDGPENASIMFIAAMLRAEPDAMPDSSSIERSIAGLWHCSTTLLAAIPTTPEFHPAPERTRA